MSDIIMDGIVISKRYRIDKLVGKGSFGTVYIGYDLLDKHLVALKISNNDPRSQVVLQHEYSIYQKLSSGQKPPLIPNIYWFGRQDDNTIMVMNCLGKSLAYLLQSCSGKFTLKTTLMIALQMFDLIMRLHNCNYIHRDIKPDNFLMGSGHERQTLYLIDFGLAKQFKSSEQVHIRSGDGKKLVGTARYASINSHRKLELSRRDDLESLGYIIIYFLKGRLPWQGIDGRTVEEKYDKIGQMKMTYDLVQLCSGVPNEIMNFLSHVRSLEFKEKPNYHYLRTQFVSLFERMGYAYDYNYDWLGVGGG